MQTKSLMRLAAKVLRPGTRLSRQFRGTLSDIEQTIREQRIYAKWKRANHPIPAPPCVKREVMRRYAPKGSIWIETGTYHGDTTSSLSKTFPHIYSIEPERSLYARACDRFFRRSNITLINNSSEECLFTLLSRLRGPIALWLDGHVSEPGTFHGAEVTPLMTELEYIEHNLNKFTEVAVFIDDARLLSGTLKHQQGYPCLSDILRFAKKNNLKYIIEHDIVVLSKQQ